MSKYQYSQDLVNRPLIESQKGQRHCFILSGDKTQIYFISPRITLDDLDIVKYHGEVLKAGTDNSQAAKPDELEKNWEDKETALVNRQFLLSQKRIIKLHMKACFPALLGFEDTNYDKYAHQMSKI